MVKKISHEKVYEFQAEKGSRVEVKIETKIKDLCKSDLEEILHEYAICTHNFYLSLGKEIDGIEEVREIGNKKHKKKKQKTDSCGEQSFVELKPGMSIILN